MSIINHVTLQTIVAHDFRYDSRIYIYIYIYISAKCILKPIFACMYTGVIIIAVKHSGNSLHHLR